MELWQLQLRTKRQIQEDFKTRNATNAQHLYWKDKLDFGSGNIIRFYQNEAFLVNDLSQRQILETILVNMLPRSYWNQMRADGFSEPKNQEQAISSMSVTMRTKRLLALRRE